MNNLEEIYSGSQSGKDYAKRYVQYLLELLTAIDLQSIEDTIKVFQEARSGGKTIFFIGNGGSAATSSHFCEDLALGTYMNGKKPFKTLSLTDNSAYITALGNDEGYENVFIGQLRSLLNKDDIVVGISGSGNSPNVVKAIEYANANGGITVGLIGFDGGKMKEICQYCIHVKTKKGVYGPVEDIHLILDHMISTYLMFRIQEELYWPPEKARHLIGYGL